MKITKKIVIPVIAVALVGAAVFTIPKIVSGSGSKAVAVSAAPLAKMDLENTVSVTGTVKSEDVTNVYSTLAYQVQSVNVEVGDSVKEGDILCVLDTSNLNSQIDSQLAALDKNQASAQHSLAVAQNNLATEQNNRQYDYDIAYENAKKSVEAAHRTLEARKSAVESAKISLDSAMHRQNSNRKALQAYQDENGKPTEYEAAYETTHQTYVQGAIAVTNAENALADAQKALKEAQEDYEKAKETADASFNATLRQQEKALTASQQQVKSAQINADLTTSVMQIDELKKDLDEANVTAPVSGIVTAVLATEGGSGQGLLFVIENTGKLKIDTKIEEYDLLHVKAGQTAKIKSDGTGDEEYEGKVSKIAPTAIKAANGATVETTDVQFATEVGITGGSGLKIGMNARLDIITEQKPNVFAVSYDAVVENENGESVVYVARPKENMAVGGDKADKKDVKAPPSFTAVAVPVETGMETDFYIEIIADSLKEGDMIISNPASLVDGQEVTLSGAAGARGAGGMGGGPGGGPGMAVRMG